MNNWTFFSLNPMPNNPQSWINAIWVGLESIDEDQFTQEQLDEIKTGMLYAMEALGCHDNFDPRIKNCTEPTCDH